MNHAKVVVGQAEINVKNVKIISISNKVIALVSVAVDIIKTKLAENAKNAILGAKHV